MTFDEYQTLALRTARGKDAKDELFHLTMGLVGEAGEVAEKVKKIIRDHNSDESALDIPNLSKELGDVLWHIAVLGNYFDIPLEKIADDNIEKLASRLKRGTISGSGDDR
jgi:NTP pyrophosphatase (non-canonical NTP hydrolase)